LPSIARMARRTTSSSMRRVSGTPARFVDYDVDEALSMKGGMTEGLKYMYEILEDLSV